MEEDARRRLGLPVGGNESGDGHTVKASAASPTPSSDAETRRRIHAAFTGNMSHLRRRQEQSGGGCLMMNVILIFILMAVLFVVWHLLIRK